MDRFAVGLADQQEQKPVDYCEECGGEIYSGDRVWKLSSAPFCRTQCLLDYMQVEKITME